MLDADGSGERHKPTQIDQRKRDPLGIQPACQSDPTTKTAQDPFVQKWKQSPAQALEDHKAEGVRTQVDYADAVGRRHDIPVRHRLSERQASVGRA